MLKIFLNQILLALFMQAVQRQTHCWQEKKVLFAMREGVQNPTLLQSLLKDGEKREGPGFTKSILTNN